jgi:glucose/arabinose dehydrogenase
VLLLAACSSDEEVLTSTTATTVADTTAETVAPETTAGDTLPERTLPPTTSTTPLTDGSVTFTAFADGMVRPVDSATRDFETWVVAQQDGRIVPFTAGTVGEPLLDLSDQITSENEQGLLGLAYHPTRPFLYVDYTDLAGDTVVAEFAVNDDGSIDAASQRTVITVDQPYANHNGGKITFGTDGMLYIGLGDGGAGGDPERRAMDLSSPLGKILRIDPLGSGYQPYSVPPDNPFVGVDGARPEIWSYGLRNPWRFAFDPSTDDLWIGDVGQGDWEEVNVALAADGGGRGVNFGWSALEGTHPFNADQSGEGSQLPIWEYQHGDDGCSVSGGTVYRGNAVPSLVGWYVVTDYCSGKVWALQADGTVVVLGTVTGNPSAIVTGPDGELYVLAHSEGVAYRIDPA